MKTKILTEMMDLIRVLESEKGVLHEPAPGAHYCEITYPDEEYVAYECPTVFYSRLASASNAATAHGEVARFTRVYLLEPGCAGGWSIVCKTNREALLYQIEAPKLVPLAYTDEE
jgi:hypothetical protein